jgi:hypothetical protein
MEPVPLQPFVWADPADRNKRLFGRVNGFIEKNIKSALKKNLSKVLFYMCSGFNVRLLLERQRIGSNT